MKYSIPFLPLSLLTLIMGNATAALPFIVETTSGLTTSGTTTNFSGGSWQGDGTVQTTVDVTDGLNNASGTGTAGNDNNDTLVTGFSGTGVFTINDFSINDSDRAALSALDFGATISVTLGGTGTADIILADQNDYDYNASAFEGFHIGNFNGVTSIDITLTYTQPLAMRNDSTDDLTSLERAPWLSAIGLIDEGSTFATDDYDVTLAYSNIYSSASTSGAFTAGIPADSTAYASTSLLTPVAGGVSFTSVDGFDGYITPGVSSTNNIFVKGFEYDPLLDANDTPSTADAVQFYATTVTFTITPDGDSGTPTSFDAGTKFSLSFDGDIHSNFSNIPEPASFSLLFIGGALLCFQRSRKC